MDPVAAQNNQPSLWTRGELSIDQVGHVSTGQLRAYWLWCEGNANPWMGVSGVARCQARRVRNRESAAQARRDKAVEIAQLRAELERERSENQRLHQYLAQLEDAIGRAVAMQPDSSADFDIEMFGVVVDNHGRPMMYIGTEC